MKLPTLLKQSRCWRDGDPGTPCHCKENAVRKVRIRAQRYVVVVDDAAEQLDVMLEYLHPLYQVRTAASGLEGLAQAKILPLPELILQVTTTNDCNRPFICRAGHARVSRPAS